MWYNIYTVKKREVNKNELEFILDIRCTQHRKCNSADNKKYSHLEVRQGGSRNR
jgi:hypothetical protein